MLKIKKPDFNKSFDKVNHNIFMNDLKMCSIALYYNLIHLLNNHTKNEE